MKKPAPTLRLTPSEPLDRDLARRAKLLRLDRAATAMLLLKWAAVHAPETLDEIENTAGVRVIVAKPSAWDEDAPKKRRARRP